MRIGIDIDGVFTYLEQWRFDCESKFFSKYNKSIINRKGYEIFDVSEKLDGEFWDQYLIEYSTKEPARKFDAEIINKLKEENNEIFIITARYFTTNDDDKGNQMRKIVKEWLNEQNISYDKIIFSPEDKLEVCLNNNIDLMIEDKATNINKISAKLPVICLDAEYNRKCKEKNIYRCYAWHDIYNLIKSREIYKKPRFNFLFKHNKTGIKMLNR